MKTIRLLLTALTALVTTFGMAQTTITPPYNPNANDDPLIQTVDLLAFLSIYGEEFYPAEILVDGQSLELYIQQLEEAAANATGDSVLVPVMIPGTAVGQILYWSGTSWQLLDPGEPGQVLHVGTDQLPSWQHTDSVLEGVVGCADSTACNYSAEVTLSYPEFCDYLSCLGCTDPLYLEFSPTATVEDGSCTTLAIPGCTNPFYLEFDESANQDDGSCATLIVPGCTDSLYVEFNPLANTDDGSCATIAVPGCTDPLYVEYDAFANQDDGSCVTLIVPGCTDPTAENYDATATEDDGSCSYTVTVTLSVGASDLTVECDASADAAIDAWLASNGGATAAGGCGGLIWSHDYAGVEGYCSGTGEAYVTFTAMDNCGNAASTSATLTIVDWTAPDLVVGAQDGVADCDGTEETQLSAWLGNLGGASAVDACDDAITWSYDFYESSGAVVEYVATFTASDGCGNATSTMATFTIDCPASIPGCTDPAAENYDPSATEDDGSCTFASTCTPVTFDGYSYDVVQIGAQCWFAENLRSDNYRNGDAIPGNLSNTGWTSTTAGAQAIYNNNAGNLATYGRLYNWYAVDDDRGLCPTGWHVPTDGEWTTLTDFLGGSSVAGHAMKSSPSDSPSWTGSNTSGFSALPGGFRGYSNGNFYDEGASGFWWSSSPNGSNYAWFRYLTSDNVVVYRYNGNQRNGFSVRCVRD